MACRHLCKSFFLEDEVSNWNDLTEPDANSFAIYSQNVQCLTTSLNGLNVEISLLKNCKTIFITEHWLPQEHLNSISLMNFDLASSYCRRTSSRGGSAIYTSKDLPSVPNTFLNELAEDFIFEYCSVTVTLANNQYLLICVYRTPYSDFTEFCDKFEQLLTLAADLHLTTFIAGDFNMDILTDNRRTQQLTNMLESFGIEILIKEPTRVSKTSQTCLDNILTLNRCNKLVRCISALTFHTSFSDHKAKQPISN